MVRTIEDARLATANIQTAKEIRESKAHSKQEHEVGKSMSDLAWCFQHESGVIRSAPCCKARIRGFRSLYREGYVVLYVRVSFLYI